MMKTYKGKIKIIKFNNVMVDICIISRLFDKKGNELFIYDNKSNEYIPAYSQVSNLFILPELEVDLFLNENKEVEITVDDDNRIIKLINLEDRSSNVQI